MCQEEQNKEITSPIKFRVNIQSDILGLVERVNERESAMPVTRNLRQPGGDAVLKWHKIQLTTGEEESVIARLTVHTISGATFRRLNVSLDDLGESCENGDVMFNLATVHHLASGVNFLQVRELIVLPKFQGQGLGSWLLKEGPEIVAEFLGQAFSYIVFPVEPCIFHSEFLTNQALANDFARERFVQERAKQLVKMLKSAGYHRIPDDPKIFEKMF